MSLSYISNSRFNTFMLLYVECIPLLLLLASVTTKHSYVHHITSLGTVYSPCMYSLEFQYISPWIKKSVPYQLIYTLIAQYYFKNISQFCFCFSILFFIVNLLIKKGKHFFCSTMQVRNTYRCPIFTSKYLLNDITFWNNFIVMSQMS